MFEPESLGMRIRLTRTRQRMPLKALAQAVGMSRNALANIEHDRSDPVTSHLRAIAVALGVSMDYLVGLCADAPPQRPPS